MNDPQFLYRIFGKDMVLRHKELFSGKFHSRKIDVLLKVVCEEVGKQERGSFSMLWRLWDRIYQDSINIHSTRDIYHLNAVYDECILEIDNVIKKILVKIDELGLSNKTIIVITSAHGEEFGEHGRVSMHSQFYDETIHVPLIMRIPGISILNPNFSTIEPHNLSIVCLGTSVAPICCVILPASF